MREPVALPSDQSESCPEPPAPLWAPSSALGKLAPDRGDGQWCPGFQSRLRSGEHAGQLGGDRLGREALYCVKAHVLLYCIILYAYVT